MTVAASSAKHGPGGDTTDASAALARLAEWQGARIAAFSTQLKAQQAQSAALEKEVVHLRQQLACVRTAASTAGGLESVADHVATVKRSTAAKDVCSGSNSSDTAVANSFSPR